MWQKFDSRGADAAPLLIPEVILRYHWRGVPVQEKLMGKIDTAASLTAIPIKIARQMQLPSAGQLTGLRSFDESIDLPPYPKFRTEIFIPPWDWQIVDVVGCQRETVLIGRDLCKQMLLVVDWHGKGFGLRPACFAHRLLQPLFWRLRKKIP